MKIINLSFLLLCWSSLIFAQSDIKTEEQCKLAHPGVSQIFKRNDCVSNAKKSEKREEEARPCLAKSIPAMEEAIKGLMKDILPTDSLDAAASKVSKVTGDKSFIDPSDSNIKHMVAVNEFGSKCVSGFYYLINVTRDEDAKLLSFQVWAKLPPKGYTNTHENGYRPEFFVDFVAKRKVIDRAKLPIQENKPPLNLSPKSHCEPNLTQKERLARLARNGQVLQSSEREYRAGIHVLRFSYDNSLSYCN